MLYHATRVIVHQTEGYTCSSLLSTLFFFFFYLYRIRKVVMCFLQKEENAEKKKKKKKKKKTDERIIKDIKNSPKKLHIRKFVHIDKIYY